MYHWWQKKVPPPLFPPLPPKQCIMYVSVCKNGVWVLCVKVWSGVGLRNVDDEMKSSCCTMVMVKVSVHPAGLGPREAGKAWYSIYFITHVQL